MSNWITEAELKACTVIQDNVGNYLFDNDIIYAQVTKIQSCLGEDLTKRINDEIADTISTEIQALLDEIKNPLAVWTFYMAIPNFQQKFTNKGIFIKSDATNQASSVEDVEYIRRQYKDRAEFWTNQMIQFVIDNKEDYPEYKNCDTECAQKKGFDFGMGYVTAD